MSDLPAIPSGTCPFCGERSTSQCRCMRSDMECPNGHQWHHDKDQIHAGHSNHGSPKCCMGEVIAIAVRTTEAASNVAKRFANRD